MKCPVCGSPKTESGDYAFQTQGSIERRWDCNDCESKWTQTGLYFSGDDIEVWDKRPIIVKPSEQGERILAEKRDQELMKLAQRLTIQMFADVSA